jgi:hypothetical protein
MTIVRIKRSPETSILAHFRGAVKVKLGPLGRALARGVYATYHTGFVAEAQTCGAPQMDIDPGSMVAVELTRPPTNAAARKTLARLLRKDPQVARRERWKARHRPSWQTWRRGGRLWHHQMTSTPGVDFSPGSRYTIRASVDVIRDLASVESFVKVAPA